MEKKKKEGGRSCGSGTGDAGEARSLMGAVPGTGTETVTAGAGAQSERQKKGAKTATAEGQQHQHRPLHLRQLLERSGKEKGGVKGVLGQEFRDLNNDPRLIRSFRDGMEEREAGKISQPGVLVYDRTRFKLTHSLTNFINASELASWDGKKAAYILTQIPSLATQGDFWQMVYQAGVSTIAVLLPIAAFPAHKVAPWWPLSPPGRQEYGRFAVDLDDVLEGLEWRAYFLRLSLAKEGKDKGDKSDKGRVVRLLHYEAWRGEVEPPAGLPRLIGRCRHFQAQGDAKNGLADPPSPLTFVCPSGVQRCGLVAVLALAMAQLQSTYTINLPALVRAARSQRYGVLSKGWEYLWLHKRVAELVLSHDLVPHTERLDIATRLVPFSAEMEPEDPASFGGPSIFPSY